MKISLENWIQADRRNYQTKKKRIEEALAGATGIVSGVTEENKEDVFYMLLFCLCVPQSKAIKAEDAIDILRSKDYLHCDISASELLKTLAGRVRFHGTKYKRLIAAKELFLGNEFWPQLKEHYKQYKETKEDERDKILRLARKWLMATVDGIGMKLAGHFLRNVGMSGLAILDVHVLNGMEKRGLINPSDTKPLTNSRYESISKTMKSYAKEVGISMDELDLLLWSQRTGYVFK